MTACKDCKHFLLESAAGVFSRMTDGPIWHEMFCRASPMPPEFDPYLGKFNEKEEFYHCRSINKGDCQQFEAKEEVTA